MISLKKIIFIFSIFFTIVLIASVFSLPQNEKNIAQTPLPTPVLIPNATSAALPGIVVPDSEVPVLQQEKMVGKLLDILPVVEENFSFDYDYFSNIFSLSLKGNDSALGNKEFDEFLQKNGVENRSWIENLEVKSENSTPAP